MEHTPSADNRTRQPLRRRATSVELALLVLGLGALAFGAGAIGWVIGHSMGGTHRVVTTVAAAPTPASSTSTVKGDPAKGETVFVNAGCGSCHVLAATGATGTLGPSLDQTKLTPAEILDWVANGKGAMPSFKDRLTERQLNDVAAFLGGGGGAGETSAG